MYADSKRGQNKPDVILCGMKCCNYMGLDYLKIIRRKNVNFAIINYHKTSVAPDKAS